MEHDRVATAMARGDHIMTLRAEYVAYAGCL
jgi:hypothetical protein